MNAAVRVSMVFAAIAALVLTGAPVRAEPADDGNRAWSVRPGTADGKPDRRTHYTLQGDPGGKVSETVLVTNASKVRAAFVIYGTDAFNTATGAFDLLPQATKPTDIGGWFTFPGQTVEIDAGATAAIPFSIEVPKNATPGDHAGGVVVSLATTGTDVKLDTRVAVRVYLRIAGLLRPVLEAQKVQATYSGTINPFGTGGVDVTYTVVNTGNIRLSSHAKVFADSSIWGGSLGSTAKKDLPELLPGQRVTYTAHLDRVYAAGPIDVNVELEPYADPAQPVGQQIPVARTVVTVWGMPWIITLLLVALLGGLGYFLSRYFRRPRPPKAPTAKAAQPGRTKLDRKAKPGKQATATVGAGAGAAS